jgi:hypothetical protein
LDYNHPADFVAVRAGGKKDRWSAVDALKGHKGQAAAREVGSMEDFYEGIFDAYSGFFHKTFCEISFRDNFYKFRAKILNKRRCLFTKISGGAFQNLQPKFEEISRNVILQKVYNTPLIIAVKN